MFVRYVGYIFAVTKVRKRVRREREEGRGGRRKGETLVIISSITCLHESIFALG